MEDRVSLIYSRPFEISGVKPTFTVYSLYYQQDGSSMGSCLLQVADNIFIDALEKKYKKNEAIKEKTHRSY